MTKKPLKMLEFFPGHKLVVFKTVSGFIFFGQFLKICKIRSDCFSAYSGITEV